MSSKVFQSLLRVSSQIRTFNLVNAMKLYRSNYYLNNCCMSSKDSKVKDQLVEKVNFTFVQPDGEEISVSGCVGETVMTVAMQNDCGIEGACEGSLACTTCHCYVDEKTLQIVPEPIEKEDDLLDVAVFQKPNSRLSCQLIVSKEMEGAVFTLPKGTVNMRVDS